MHRRHLPGDGRAREAAKDLMAARVLQHYHEAGDLPAFLPGEPNAVAALATAPRHAPHVLSALARIYGVTEWDADAYRRYYLERALAAWTGGARVESTPEGLRVVTRSCPVFAEASRDFRVCQACRLLKEATARLASGGELEDVRHERLLMVGDEACVMALDGL